MEKTKWKVFLVIMALAVLAIAFTGLSADGKRIMKSEKIILTPDELTWKEGPIPKTQIVILDGDPKKKGFFVMRIKLPAGTKIPPHVHDNIERVTVISGEFNLAMGHKPENPTVLPAGSYFSLPSGTLHNAWVDQETVLQISTKGPWTFKLREKAGEEK
jgi:quercetin dioxygenase-like cupin family protein